MCETARLGVATEINAFGEYHHRVFSSPPKPPAAQLQAMARRVLAAAPSRLRGLAHLATLARGMGFLARWPHSVTVITDDHSQRGANDRARAVDRVMRSLGGRRLAPTLGSGPRPAWRCWRRACWRWPPG